MSNIVYPSVGSTDMYPVSATPAYRYALSMHDGIVHKVSYLMWGNLQAKKVIFCVHGLTGDATNFDYFASYFSEQQDCLVVSVDLIGRGNSARPVDAAIYTVTQYALDVLCVYNHVSSCLETTIPDPELRTGPQSLSDKLVREYYYLGNSLGGQIGFHIAASKDAPFKAYIINDISPSVLANAAARISKYVGASEGTQFASMDEAVDFMTLVYSSYFGPFINRDYFVQRCLYALRKEESGKYVLNYYTRGILRSITHPTTVDEPVSESDVTEDSTKRLTYFKYYDQITAPMLVYHGMDSDVLNLNLVEEMKQRYNGASLAFVHWEKTGHQPPLVCEREFLPIVDFINKY